mmetsp:Transcript_74639/g.241344  ORF Transcript_74639/g.241344 Transcript_74639/m.241344 type:complete len:1505 (+) Transcript_74639:47-4561(+)
MVVLHSQSGRMAATMARRLGIQGGGGSSSGLTLVLCIFTGIIAIASRFPSGEETSSPGFVPPLPVDRYAGIVHSRGTVHSEPQQTTVQNARVVVPAFAALLGVCAASRRHLGRKRATRPQLQAIGSVETKKFLGDWAALAPSAASQDDGLSVRELVKVELNGGITEVRGIYPAGNERYGEEYQLNAGSTDNAFLMTPVCSAPSVLVGVHDDRFAKEFLDVLGKEAVERLGHVVLQFFDGKQVHTLEELILAQPADKPPLTVHCANAVAIALESKLSKEAKERCTIDVLKNESTLEVEEGRTMRFVLTPTPKTPEGVVAFDPATGTLFSGKFFSAHSAVTDSTGCDSAGNQGWEAFADDWFHFFDCYFFSQNAQRAIRKLFMLAEALHGPDVEQLAPLHGPVVREQCWKLMAKYEAWTESKLRKEEGRDSEVLVMYASAYGHTKTLANAIGEGLKTSGVKVNMLNLEHCTAKDVSSALETCNGFFVGSPTLGGEMPTQVKEALGVVLSAASSEDTQRVPCGVFGSYGWSGEAVDELHFRLKDGGFPFACDPIRVRFRPTDDALELCKEAGVRMSQKLQTVIKERQRRRVRKIDAKQGNASAEAFGKMRSCRCLLTTLDPEGGDVVSTVSWVNQASFDPPGVTVSVPKTDLDPFLTLTTDEQLEILFKKYDVDGGGELDREEVTDLLKDLFGVKDTESAKLNESMIDEALKVLDENNDGSVSLDEIREASQDGPLARALEQKRKLLALENAIGSAPQGVEKQASGGLPFVLNMLPQTIPTEALMNPERHPKKKATNGCLVHKESNAFIECAVTQALDAGDHTILYAQVLSGVVLNDNELTGMVSVIEKKSNSAKASTPAVAMAAGQGSRATAVGPVPLRSAFVAGAAPRGFPAARRGMVRMGRASIVPRAATSTIEPPLLSEIQSWEGLTPGKQYRLQTMTVKDIAADTSTIRSLDWDRDRFDIEFALERGTTYNSYVIKGADKVAIVDTSHEKFEGLFFDALDKEVDYASVNYLIVSHTEPDHSGLIQKVVAKAAAAGNTELTVVGSKVCIQFLENLIHTPFKSQIVANNAKIDLGGGHELEFVIAPNLHWPDTMFTYDHGTSILYTCDAFGMHYCSDALTDVEGVQDLLPHYALYYDCLMKPNARSVLTALKKTAGFDFHTIATGHGPMLKESTSEWVDQYKSWSEKATAKLGPSAAVFWVSNYGESERLAQVFAHGITSSNVTVEMHDLNAIDAFELTECLARNEVLAVMAPPQGQNSAQSAISNIIAGAKAKKHRFMVLESSGENDEPLELLERRFMQQEIPMAMPAMTVSGGFGPQTMQGFEEAGMGLGKLLGSKAKVSKVKQLDKEMERALGRLSSSLYVVTAAKAGVRHAMVASWVTPASESPLGVTLAVAKDRAMEPLLHTGDSFNVNFLEEGRSLGVMKHFLQKFQPGQDRLAGVEVFPAGNGAPVLKEAHAFMECKVMSRMDASDHWVCYAEVCGGNVARSDAMTAVHHRKVGTYY